MLEVVSGTMCPLELIPDLTDWAAVKKVGSYHVSVMRRSLTPPTAGSITN
jgi:hypothetical protein